MPLSLNEKLLDAAIIHQIGLERYATGLVRQVLDVLETAQLDLAMRLKVHLDLVAVDRLPAAQAVDRLRGILRELEQRTADIYSSLYRYILAPAMRALAALEIAYQLGVLRAVLPATQWAPPQVDVAATVEASPLVLRRGLLLEQEIDATAARQAAGVTGAVQGGLAQGIGTAEILRRVLGTYDGGYKDGILQVGRTDAASVTRTAVTHAAGTARQALLEANGSAIAGILLIPTLDGRTTVICLSIGEPGGIERIQPLVGGVLPPFHFKCRTVTAPILIRGTVPDEPTLAAVLRRQPVALQDEVLGWRRGRKLRATGKLDEVAVLKTIAGKAYSLDQLVAFGRPN